MVFYPIGLVLTLLAGWLTMLVAVIWNSRAASRYVAAKWGKVLGMLTPIWVTVEGAENADPGK